jgi:hypothetical protein
MMRLAPRIAGLCALLLAAMACAAVCVLQMIYVRNARRADALLNDVRSLRVGESPTADVQRIVQKYGGFRGDTQPRPGASTDGCPEPNQSYNVGVGNDALFALGQRFPSLWFAIRPRGAGATFLVKAGKLCWLEYDVSSFFERNEWPLQVQATMLMAGSWVVPYSTFEASGNIHTLLARATSDAPLEDRHKALAFDLSCLKKFDGCRTACELLPSAWLDWQTQGYASPEDMNPPWCEKATAKRLIAQLSSILLQRLQSDRCCLNVPFPGEPGGPHNSPSAQIADQLLELGKSDPAARAYLVAHLPAFIGAGPQAFAWVDAVRLAGDLKIVEAAPALAKFIGIPIGPAYTLGESAHLKDSPAGLALVEIGDPAVPALDAVLEHRNVNDRWEAAYALNLIGSTEAEAVLTKDAPHERDETLRDFIARATAK